MAATLPPGARVHAARKSNLSWTIGDHLTAAVVDHLRQLNYTLQVVNIAERSDREKVPVPEMVRRPEDEAAQAADEAAAAAAREVWENEAFSVLYAEQQRLAAEAQSEPTETGVTDASDHDGRG